MSYMSSKKKNFYVFYVNVKFFKCYWFNHGMTDLFAIKKNNKNLTEIAKIVIRLYLCNDNIFSHNCSASCLQL